MSSTAICPTRSPIVPGHEIVGRIEAAGDGAQLRPGARVGVPWLGHTCGQCPYCRSARENLCDAPLFPGYTRDGGFATHVIADADFAFPLGDDLDPVAAAPLLCAGLIGWRSLRRGRDRDDRPLRLRRGGPYFAHVAAGRGAGIRLHSRRRRRRPRFRTLDGRAMGRRLGTRGRLRRSTPPFCSRRLARSSRRRSPRCARAAGSSAAEFT